MGMSQLSPDPLHIQLEPLRDCGGCSAASCVYTHTHTDSVKRKYSTILTCHCMQRTHVLGLFHCKLHCSTLHRDSFSDPLSQRNADMLYLQQDNDTGYSNVCMCVDVCLCVHEEEI